MENAHAHLLYLSNLFPGTCLTVTAYDASQPDTFKVGLSPETLRRTNLGSLTVSSHVNLERAVAASSRMGGHFVQGHVDTVATILSTKQDGNALVLRLQPRDRSVLKYVVEKGYVALDGASLTVTAVDGGDGDGGGWFEIMLVAYTQEKIVTAKKGKGDEVNVEVDMVGKYVEKNVAAYFAAEGEKGRNGWIQKIVEQTVSKTAGAASK